MKYSNIYLFLLFMGLSWGCESSPTKMNKLASSKPTLNKKIEVKAEVNTQEKKSTAWYSPFVVDISSEKMVFNTISFKDVTQGDVSPQRDTTMETLADSLGMAIGEDPSFKASCEMRYDEEITKPSNHKACGQNHLYIDVWEEGDNYGYSMWSGCSAEDEFAHSSVALPKSEDPNKRVAPLVSAIRKKLVTAHSTKCFLKTC